MAEIVGKMTYLKLIIQLSTMVIAEEYKVECQSDQIVISFDQQYLQGSDTILLTLFQLEFFIIKTL